MAGGYSRCLAHYPYVIVVAVALVTAVCVVVMVIFGSTPAFSDPKLGFVARGTDLSARMLTYHKLLDETRGMLTSPLADRDYISAADLGTELDDVMRNRTLQREHVIPRPDVMYKQRRRHGSDVARTGTAGKDWQNDDDDMEATTASAMTSIDFVSNDAFFCDKPQVAYARYAYVHANASNLLTYDNVRLMCNVDERIRRLHSFNKTCICPAATTSQCCRTWSLSNYIALLTNRSSCAHVTAEDVTSVRELLETCVPYYETRQLQKCSFADHDSLRNRDACAQVPIECMRHRAVYDMFQYILDVNYLKPSDKTRNDQLTYAMSFIPLASGISTEDLYYEMDSINKKNNAVQIVAINFGLKDVMFDYYLRVDSFYFIGAVLTVILIMWFYTKSFFLTLMSLLSILMSLLMSYCLYTVVYAIEFFPYMNLMAVVLLIGIGADDVFLYCRIWHLAKLEKNVGTLEKVVSDTLRHASLSMFVTSFTTAAALLANLLSDITALRCFSIFASTTIVVNLAMMLTWIPAAIVIQDKWFSECCYCYDPDFYAHRGCCYSVCKIPHTIYTFLSNHARMFFENILPFVVIKLRYLWLSVLCLVGMAGILIVVYYPKLNLPATREFQVFAKKHPFEVYDFRMKNEFRFEIENSIRNTTLPLTFVWGVKARDTGNKLEPRSETTLQYESTFSVSTPDAQRTLLRFCRDLYLSPWYRRTVGMKYTNCFMEQFREHMKRRCSRDDASTGRGNHTRAQCCGHTAFPFEQGLFDRCLKQWVESVRRSKNMPYADMNPYAGPRYAKDSDEIVALVVQVESKQQYSFNYDDMNRFYAAMNLFVDTHLSRAPPEINGGWFVSNLEFYDLQSSLAHGTPIAIGVSIAIATVVAFLTTLNVLITLWAMVSISATVFVVVAILVLIGWELNIMEAVTLTVAVGLAMDFTLHYGMGYRLSPDDTREQRVICSMRRIGSPVAMAALSTFLAGAFVLPATIQAYRQLGVFLMIVMSVSWVYATFFFQSLLRVIGPIGSFSQFSWPTSDCCTGQPHEHVDKTVYSVCESHESLTSIAAAANRCVVSSSCATTTEDTTTAALYELEPLTAQNERDAACDDVESFKRKSSPVRNAARSKELQQGHVNDYRSEGHQPRREGHQQNQPALSIHKHSSIANGQYTQTGSDTRKPHHPAGSSRNNSPVLGRHHKSLLASATLKERTLNNNQPVVAAASEMLNKVGEKLARTSASHSDAAADPVWIRRSLVQAEASNC